MFSCGGASEPEPPATAESETEPAAPTGTQDDPFVGQGFVREVGDGTLTIEHGDIPGLMSAMTMSYPVAEASLLEALEVDSEITFYIEVLESGHQIFSIEAASTEGSEEDEDGAAEVDEPTTS